MSFPLHSLTAAFLLLTLLSGCAERPETGPRLVRVWCHQGQEKENLAMREIAAAFNRAHRDDGIEAAITFFPDFQYTEKVAIAAAARDLPDVLEIDGPLVARFVRAGLLAPLDAWFEPAELADFLPTIREQGTIDGRLYALGAFDSAVVLYYDREMLARAGVEPAPEGRGWAWDEFLHACERLQAAGIEPLAMHFDESADEWYTYAFSPVLWSGGGRLIGSDGVRGVLATPENIASLRQWQEVFRRGFAATDPVDPNPFGRGRVAMDWTGHWMARSHRQDKSERLGAMPLPRSGTQPAAPCGSWCWGITTQARDPGAAAAWVRWVTDAQHGIVPIVRANGAVPARRSAFAAFPEYAQPPYSLFREQLEQFARPRPRTPHYPTLTQRFAAALRDIARGAEVDARLRLAEDEIQAVIDRRQSSGVAIHKHDDIAWIGVAPRVTALKKPDSVILSAAKNPHHRGRRAAWMSDQPSAGLRCAQNDSFSAVLVSGGTESGPDIPALPRPLENAAQVAETVSFSRERLRIPTEQLAPTRRGSRVPRQIAREGDAPRVFTQSVTRRATPTQPVTGSPGRYTREERP